MITLNPQVGTGGGWGGGWATRERGMEAMISASAIAQRRVKRSSVGFKQEFIEAALVQTRINSSSVGSNKNLLRQRWFKKE